MEETDGGLLTKRQSERKRKANIKREKKRLKRDRRSDCGGKNTSKNCVQTGIREAEK